jgi:hypothetical protein
VRTTTLSCPEHSDCVVQLVKEDDVAPEDVLLPPTWAIAWSSQTEGQLTRIDHVPAVRHPDGLLIGSDALLEARVRKLERKWWRRKR